MNSRMHAALPLLFDVVAPLAVYYILHGIFGVSDVLALTIGGLVAGIDVLYQVIRKRKIDLLAVLVLAMFALTLALVFVTGDARFVLAKAAVFTAFAGLYCLATTLRKPLVYETAQPFATGGDPAKLAAWERAWQHEPAMRRELRLITAAWGIALLGDAVFRVVITYRLPLPTAVWAVQIPGIVLLVGAVVITRLRVPTIRELTTRHELANAEAA